MDITTFLFLQRNFELKHVTMVNKYLRCFEKLGPDLMYDKAPLTASGSNVAVRSECCLSRGSGFSSYGKLLPRRSSRWLNTDVVSCGSCAITCQHSVMILSTPIQKIQLI